MLVILVPALIGAIVYEKPLDKKANIYPEVNEENAPDTINLIRGTTYYVDSSQCSGSPYRTADGSWININKLYSNDLKWVALSRDLIQCEKRSKIFKDTSHWRGMFKFGDTINIHSELDPQINGKWVVHDCMAPKYKLSIDFLVHPANNKPKLGIAEDVKIIMYEYNTK